MESFWLQGWSDMWRAARPLEADEAEPGVASSSGGARFTRS